MVRSPFLVFLLICVVCSLCGKDFVSLGRHAWRCKRRVNLGNEASNRKPSTEESPSAMRHPVNTSNNIKCCCGKDCKGIRGLKMHQRSCRVMQGLDDELCEKLQDEIHNSNGNNSGLGEDMDGYDEEMTHISSEIFILKRGIKLPKSAQEWLTAKEYFKAEFSNQPIIASDIDSNIKTMGNIIYAYFVDRHGYVDSFPDRNNSILQKYCNASIKDLKKRLK